MKVLLLCDDYWHPGEVPIGGVAPLGGAGFEFDIITDGREFDPSVLGGEFDPSVLGGESASSTPGGYSVVMLAKCNQRTQADESTWITDDIQSAFVDYVEGGGGLLVVHSGTVPSPSTSKLSELMGCRFTTHPNACPVMVAPLIGHPVTEGVGAFCEIDEHYRLEILADDVLPVLASYSAEQGVAARRGEDPYHNTEAYLGVAGFVSTQGRGRVCVLTPGHLLPVWLNGEYQKVLRNALRWCGSALDNGQ